MTIDGKTYPAPWQGQILLACRKCQKKLKGREELRALANLKKTFKRYNKLNKLKKQPPEEQLHVINVPCLDLCPKDGVTVCNPARSQSRLSILRSEEGIERLSDRS